ncbi:hypothetical protein CC1G_05562 [Coprinopsis cinerea okayama7|uniref:Transmembrane protein n=1 Tax=Coprinopsis cinerea (strain Okayama-7 / 130 / ATCC MYA-4618 / FGSC 9003) TaxID=240176 RepID=A8P1E8_COPC7|nr:hypothetical protein CC1G_05562 [Coprinopsis cinerea okayama7\|eukprot:XP_001838081.2 hypothetical protein CC1G_05562 [Coprinopsis cinerea okayama7\
MSDSEEIASCPPRETFTLRQRFLVALVVEAGLYGFHIIAFFACLHSLLIVPLFGSASRSTTTREGVGGITRKALAELNAKMILAALVMCTIGSMDLAASLRTCLQLLTSRTLVFDWATYVISVFTDIQIWIGDSILLYRLWMIFEKRWKVVAFPLIFMVWVHRWVAVACEGQIVGEF